MPSSPDTFISFPFTSCIKHPSLYTVHLTLYCHSAVTLVSGVGYSAISEEERVVSTVRMSARSTTEDVFTRK